MISNESHHPTVVSSLCGLPVDHIQVPLRPMISRISHHPLRLFLYGPQVSATAKSLHLVFGQWQKDFFVNKSKEEAELEQYFLA